MNGDGAAPESATSPNALVASPFTPIADDAFLSDDAQEFGADSSRPLGNLPQTFSHLALIQAAALTGRGQELTG